MDMVSSAVVSDLVSRLISFIVEKSQVHVTTGTNGMIAKLQRLLLRAGTVVEDADGRRVTNYGMLLQLEQLRKAMNRGYYVLDCSDTWASRPKRRLVVSQDILQREMENLEATLDGMKEFLLISMHCPPVLRQPYSAHMFMERCMFGRHVEKEQIIKFLFHPSSCLDVLPVTGPHYVGKSTLVEHVCMDEVVRRNFSHILRFNGDDLNNLANDSDNDNHRKIGLSDGRSLIIVELAHDTDMVAWGKVYHSLCHGADGSKAILISRMDQVSSLGTVQAVRLARLHQEEYWYFFRVLAFGSANPYDLHPDLASIGNEIAREIGGHFLTINTITKMLRANMNKQFWLRMLGFVRKVMHMNILVFGEDPRNTQSMKLYLTYANMFSNDGPLIFFSVDRYRTGSMIQEDISNTKTVEQVFIAARTDLKIGEKFDILTESHIPPYYTYVTKCVVEKPKRVDTENKCVKRKKADNIN